MAVSNIIIMKTFSFRNKNTNLPPSLSFLYSPLIHTSGEGIVSADTNIREMLFFNS